MIKFNYTYNINSEIEYVTHLLGQLDWFKKNKYTVNFPRGVNTKKITKKVINNIITDEFKQYKPLQKYYEKKISAIINKEQKKIYNYFASFDFSFPDLINIMFTAYGPGGGYHLPNNIIIKFNKEKNINKTFQNIIHEMIHLLIEKPFIKKYKIKHENKEAIVDLLCITSNIDSLYSNYKMQSISDITNIKKQLNEIIPKRNTALKKRALRIIDNL